MQDRVEKSAIKFKMMARSGVNFINVFTRSFYAHRSQKCKKLLDLTVFFALLGSEHVKAERKMLLFDVNFFVSIARTIRSNFLKAVATIKNFLFKDIVQFQGSRSKRRI